MSQTSSEDSADRAKQTVQENVKQARDTLIKTIYAHCQTQIAIIDSTAELLQKDASWKNSSSQAETLRRLAECRTLYTNAMDTIAQRVEDTMAAEFGGFVTNKGKYHPEDVDDFLKSNPNAWDKLQKKLLDSMADVAKAEDKTKKFFEQKLPLTLSAENTFTGNRVQFQTESRHAKKKTGLILLGLACFIVAAVVLAASGATGQVYMAPLAGKLAVKGIGCLAAATKMSVATAGIVVGSAVGAAGTAAIGRAATYNEEKISTEHMKRTVVELKDDANVNTKIDNIQPKTR